MSPEAPISPASDKQSSESGTTCTQNDITACLIIRPHTGTVWDSIITLFPHRSKSDNYPSVSGIVLKYSKVASTFLYWCLLRCCLLRKQVLWPVWHLLLRRSHSISADTADIPPITCFIHCPRLSRLCLCCFVLPWTQNVSRFCFHCLLHFPFSDIIMYLFGEFYFLEI